MRMYQHIFHQPSVQQIDIECDQCKYHQGPLSHNWWAVLNVYEMSQDRREYLYCDCESNACSTWDRVAMWPANSVVSFTPEIESKNWCHACCMQ